MSHYPSGRPGPAQLKILSQEVAGLLQVPPRLTDAFVDYVARQNISIIHLEREAVLLGVASEYQTIPHHPHERDAAASTISRNSTPPLQVRDYTTFERRVKDRIAMINMWKARLRYARGVRYYRVSYEQLIGPAAQSSARFARSATD